MLEAESGLGICSGREVSWLKSNDLRKEEQESSKKKTAVGAAVPQRVLINH